MIKIKKVTKQIIADILLAAMLCGCGTTESVKNDEDIQLIEPVGISANYDEAILRNMYDVSTYSSVVAPRVTEYSFLKEQTFKKYGVAPGFEVKKGESLVYSETKDIDKQIEELQESIQDLEENHAISVDQLQKDISDAKKSEYEAHQELAKMYPTEPDVSNKDAHDFWASLTMIPEGIYKRAKQGRERLEQSLKENNEMYDLEHQFKQDSLSRLQGKIVNSSITSNEDGVVVNCSVLYGGDNVPKDTSIIAVGDLSAKLLKTEYLSKGAVAKAEDIYAIVGGKRYEVMYEPMEQEEYNRLTKDGNTVYSTFYLNDPNDELVMGQYAVLVVVKESRNNVLCIPQDAVKVENGVSSCYIYNGTDSVYTTIETGLKDGLYIEVLSGLKEGDKVLSSQAVTKGKNTATLAYGECSTEYESGGYFFYPFSEWIVNPVDTGKAYVKEVCVENFQNVAAGEVIMRLEVVSDDIEIARCQKKLERLNERLAKLQKLKADNDAAHKIDRSNEKEITANLTEQKMIQRTLGKLTKYSGIVEITAPSDGIITDKGYVKEGDLIYANSRLVQFADSTLSYIVVGDDKAALAFGNEAQIEFVDSNSARQNMAGSIVTVGNSSLTKDLVKDWALVSIPEEQRSMLNGSSEGNGGRWNRNMFTVKVKTRCMDNVLLIPKAAVEVVGGTTYVKVVQEDGTVKRTSFISGGSNNNYYWVISGLNEGMNICWE